VERSALEHDRERGNRFSEKIMLKQKLDFDLVNLIDQSLTRAGFAHGRHLITWIGVPERSFTS
jgi:hypothetical protein